MSETTQPAPPRSRVGELLQDGAALAGATLVTSGVALIDRPAGLITAGVFLLAGAWLTARKGAA